MAQMSSGHGRCPGIRRLHPDESGSLSSALGRVVVCVTGSSNPPIPPSTTACDVAHLSEVSCYTLISCAAVLQSPG
ncbi:unnamed protein product [Gadus morhua 'NCC']